MMSRMPSRSLQLVAVVPGAEPEQRPAAKLSAIEAKTRACAVLEDAECHGRRCTGHRHRDDAEHRTNREQPAH